MPIRESKVESESLLNMHKHIIHYERYITLEKLDDMKNEKRGDTVVVGIMFLYIYMKQKRRVRSIGYLVCQYHSSYFYTSAGWNKDRPPNRSSLTRKNERKKNHI